MSLDQRQQAKVWMKELIDNGRLRDVLEVVGEVCYEKASRLRDESQDEAKADYWEGLGTRILFIRYEPIF